ncbi:PAS domain S-box protein [Candidatus Obscuribacterales bacterium]|nr:PAS domain S-box protein [Candidatus Obscuribacterales bacterium]
MFASLTVTQKLLILVVVPVFFEIVFFIGLSQVISDKQRQQADLQASKAVLLKLHEFESDVARGILVITNPANPSPDIIIPQLRNLKRYFIVGAQWRDLERLDPELSEIVDDSQSIRRAMVQYLDDIEKMITDQKIDANERQKRFSTKTLAGVILNMHELSQKIVRIESRLLNEEPAQLANFRHTTQTIILSGLLAVTVIQTILAMLLVRDILGRLQRIERNLHLVSAYKPLAPVQNGNDEIARLDRVVHETNEILGEARHRELAILENAADVICSFDEKLRFTGVSATVNRLWSYTQEELLGSPLMALVPKSEQANSLADFVRISTLPSPQGELENVIRCKDGGFRNFSWSVNWSQSQKTYFCVAHDVTERRALEKLKQQFLSMVSHDLRTPVTATSNSIGLLIRGERGKLSEGVLKILERTETSIVRLTELVNDLLELDKLEAGKLVLNRAPLQAASVCLSAKEALEAMANSAYVKVVGPVEDATIFGDELRLVQAVINLLSNAIKFSPKNGTVTLAIVRSANHVELRIVDEGPGIPQEDANLIFEKFRQSATAKQSSMKSTGLGLAIVKAIAEAHGGEVGVDSEVGKGSTFWIRIPTNSEDATS